MRHLHTWNVDYRKARSLQERLTSLLVLHDRLPGKIRTIAGTDISYTKRSGLLFAAAVVLDYPSMTVIEEASAVEEVHFPYIPGLLSFREGPPLIAAFEKLKRRPDVVMLDGQGIAHPRGLGLASHMGLFLDIPTIGCAKTRLVGLFDEPPLEAGSMSELLYEGMVVGVALRTKRNVKPVFVSQGHKVGLATAVSLVLSSARGYRIPEPTRQAHMAVNRLRKEQKIQMN